MSGRSSSVRSRRWRRRSTSPRARRSRATRGSRTSCGSSPRIRTRVCSGWRSRWRPAAGKTVVMAMLIAWQTLNKLANPQDARFTDAFLVVTPGITIRDRLRVLLPEDPENYYRERDIVPAGGHRAAAAGADRHHQLPRLPAAREAQGAAKTDEGAADRGGAEPVRRDARPDGAPRLPRARHEAAASSSSTTRRTTATAPVGGEEPDRGAEGRRAQGGRAARRGGARLDHRAGGGGAEDRRQGRLRPVGHAVLPARLRLPRGDAVPVGGVRLLADRRHRGRHRQDPARAGRRRRRWTGERPTYRDLWPRIRDDLPKKGAKDAARSGPPQPAGGAGGALQSLYGNYEKSLRGVGAGRAGAAATARRRRCSSSSATTPTSRSSSSTTSPAGRSDSTTASRVVVPGELAAVLQRRGRRLVAAPEHDPRRLRSSSSPARR